MAKSEEFIKELPELAWKYIQECMDNKVSKLSNIGKVIEVKDRHIPTIDYFLRIWLPKNNGESITRETWYTWLRQDGNLKSDTIKEIDEIFTALATDIVANEGKGIFYAKNRLGMSDRQELSIGANVNLLNIDPLNDGE
jgi:hypothetical protein